MPDRTRNAEGYHAAVHARVDQAQFGRGAFNRPRMRAHKIALGITPHESGGSLDDCLQFIQWLHELSWVELQRVAAHAGYIVSVKLPAHLISVSRGTEQLQGEGELVRQPNGV